MSEELVLWHDFNVALVTAAAGLLGLLFVALSIHIRALSDRRNEELRAVARTIFLGYVVALAFGFLALMPQSLWALGVELIALNLAAVIPFASAARSGLRPVGVGYDRRVTMIQFVAGFLLFAAALTGSIGVAVGESRALFLMAAPAGVSLPWGVVDARPRRSCPRSPMKSPVSSARYSPSAATTRPMTPPWTMSDDTPASASARPMLRSSNAKRCAAYSTNVTGSESCARYAKNAAPARPTRPRCPPRKRSAPMGFAALGLNRPRRSRGSDSGRISSPYRKFANERTAAAQNGARRSTLARKPPSAGPMMNPIPNATPSMPNRAARL